MNQDIERLVYHYGSDVFQALRNAQERLHLLHTLGETEGLVWSEQIGAWEQTVGRIAHDLANTPLTSPPHTEDETARRVGVKKALRAAAMAHVVVRLAVQRKSGAVAIVDYEPYGFRVERGESCASLWNAKHRHLECVPITSILTVEVLLDTFEPRYPIEM